MADVNRLASATSPYLLQHAQNPVDWWEWSPEAFAEARRRDVPILLSVGYAACHWCHVMAHESFEDESTAAYLNAHYVPIKVDREERPDVDAVYMAATQAMTGSGGWPMTVVLDHDARPFWAGTYLPPQPRHGQPAFTQVLQALADAWRDRRGEIDQAAAGITEHLVAMNTASQPQDSAVAWSVEDAIAALAEQFDPLAGGFGGAPKFPPSMVLEFLRTVAGDAVSGTDASERQKQALHMLHRTLAAMAGGGMYDQLGGGFARYSVDRGWVVPHFEKMLYDNAQLLGLYARVGGELGERVARETAEFMLRELRTPEGGFASALDADSDDGTGRHVEGAFYAWTPTELDEALGVERGRWAAEVFEVTEAGTFEHGMSTLQLRHGIPKGEQRRFEEVRARLMDVRDQRPRPACDDKVVAAWNGLAISGLVDAAVLLDEPRYLAAAIAAAELLVTVHLRDGRLLRVSRGGVAGSHNGVLEDYGCVAGALLALAGATADAEWMRRGLDLLDVALAQFCAADGGFHDTAADAEQLVVRPRDASDNASPSGTSAMIHALRQAYALTGAGRYLEAADQAVASVGGLMSRAPRFAGWSLAAAATEIVEVAVVGPAGAERTALAQKAWRMPGAVVVIADAATEGIPLLDGRTQVDGEPAAYVCRNFVCERPVTDPAELRA
ncbi:thioredoxin domain-containing protein [Nocardioides baekrokdamisoli]|uniref:Thioredoxin domain-containing protein n=1 Tax=Nocardioides baekrokdamisoli TaxID=1804624 RepID=A0A3G9J4R6_9ACTN|nr:thioredoxin domain-containing protein [Nocardioides baekrokdamisoli]BBH18029.1 thioredoxin domain-containing protein [Nocardioides baekrokdamisoli]